MLVIGVGAFNYLDAKTKKPPRPEKIEEVIPDQPSEYHRWVEGKWKWKKKADQWMWKKGYWNFDHDLYAYRNRFRFNNTYWPYRIRYYAVPIGRGFYRIIAI